MNTKINNYLSSVLPNYLDQEKEFFVSSTEFTNKYLNFDFSLNVCTKELSLQAKIFSNFLDSKNLNKVTRMLGPSSNFNKIAYETYIYSYVKSLYLGLFDSNFSSTANHGKALLGHCVFKNFLCCKRLQGNMGDYSVTFFGNYGSEKEKYDLVDSYIREFSFLKEFSLDQTGNQFLFSSKYERYLEYLENIKKEYGDIRDENKNKNTSMSYTLEVRDLNDETLDKVTKIDNIPFLNMFYSKDLKQLFYIRHAKEAISFNSNYFISRSVFLTCNLTSDGPINIKDNLYRKVEFIEGDNLHNDHKHLFLSDVHAITGLFPDIIPIDNGFNRPKGFENFNLLEKFSNLSEDELIIILEKLGMTIEQYMKFRSNDQTPGNDDDLSLKFNVKENPPRP